MRPIDIRGLCPLLQVFDMPLSVRFYCEVLGFEISSRSPTYAVENDVELFHWALLRRGDTELMLNTAYDEGQRPPSPELERVARHGDTGLFFGCPDVDAAYEHVKSHGVACAAPKTAWYGMRQLSFSDPDGYGITLQWRAACMPVTFRKPSSGENGRSLHFGPTARPTARRGRRGDNSWGASRESGCWLQLPVSSLGTAL